MGGKEGRRRRREERERAGREAHGAEVWETFGDFRALWEVGLEVYVAADGSHFTFVGYSGDFPGEGEEDVQAFLARHRRWGPLVEDLRAKTKSEEGRRVLLEAYKLFQAWIEEV